MAMERGLLTCLPASGASEGGCPQCTSKTCNGGVQLALLTRTRCRPLVRVAVGRPPGGDPVGKLGLLLYWRTFRDVAESWEHKQTRLLQVLRPPTASRVSTAHMQPRTHSLTSCQRMRRYPTRQVGVSANIQNVNTPRVEDFQ